MSRNFTIRLIGTLLLSVILCGYTYAHTGKPRFHVIIDTDGAVDDMRAITMLLSGQDIRVLAICCSQGSLPPDEASIKVRSLLTTFHHEGIPVGVGRDSGADLPSWGPFARSIQWGNGGNEAGTASPVEAAEVLDNAIPDYPGQITLIALGSLRTFADWIRTNPDKMGRIDRIIWYNNHHTELGFNYKASPESYDYIIKSGIRLDIVFNASGNLPVSQVYLDHIRSAGSIYAERIAEVHTQPAVVEKIETGRQHLWDDLVPLFLTAPLLFQTEDQKDVRLVTISGQIPPAYIYEAIGKLLESATAANNRVFSAFPEDTALYKPEYAAMANSTIRAYGSVEWKAICLTNEVHGHTGVYSIIGAKMGIRAMEYFNLGVNNLAVTTFVGHHPPLSCFNDGIQISSGATIGQGLISVSDSISPVPSAIFEFNHRRVHMALKQEIAGQIRDDIKFGVDHYGLNSDKYWRYIEEKAIRYWAGFDRHEIFEIRKM